MSYAAIVSRVHTRPHPNADRLKLGLCVGNQVIVGLDTQDEELGVYFPSDGQLSEQFCLAHNLYSESARLKLGLPITDVSFGFFSERRRVRAQSFRGQKSDGFWMPLTCLQFTGGDIGGLREGDTLDTFNGVPICNKYFTPATVRAQGKVGRKQRENMCFPKHDVTKQFKHVSELIPKDAVYYITEKLHGTSGRYGLVLDYVQLPVWKRLVNKVYPVFPEREYAYLNGSKNVILEKTTGPGYYGTNEFRYKAIEGVTLYSGEILYFEIVGYVNETTPIMPPHPVKDEVKSLRKQYGDTINYTYGCQPGQCDIYVYKIVRMNEDGVGIDLSWPQVVGRCRELGLKTVPLLASAIGSPELDPEGKALREAIDRETEGPSVVDKSHIREGCVLRVESPEGITYVKNKSWVFKFLEGIIKDADDYIDIEEVS
jgi:RNA ligase-like protein